MTVRARLGAGPPRPGDMVRVSLWLARPGGLVMSGLVGGGHKADTNWVFPGADGIC